MNFSHDIDLRESGPSSQEYICLFAYRVYVQRHTWFLTGSDSNKILKQAQQTYKVYRQIGLWKYRKEEKENHDNSQQIKLNNFTGYQPLGQEKGDLAIEKDILVLVLIS